MLDVVKPVSPSFVLPTITLRQGVRRAAKAALHALMWPARVLAARRLLNQLGGFSDHELADIGISRSDLFSAAAGPADSDPSDALTLARHQRRASTDWARHAWPRRA